jgi:hypothetical protein
MQIKGSKFLEPPDILLELLTSIAKGAGGEKGISYHLLL